MPEFNSHFDFFELLNLIGCGRNSAYKTGLRASIWCYILPSLLVSNGCSISRCCGKEVLFLIGREILPTKYLRNRKFLDLPTKFKKLPTASEARGSAAPHAPPRSDAPASALIVRSSHNASLRRRLLVRLTDFQTGIC